MTNPILRGGIPRINRSVREEQEQFDQWRKKFATLRLPPRALEYMFMLHYLVKSSSFTHDATRLFFKYRDMSVSLLEYTCLSIGAKLFSINDFVFVSNTEEVAQTEMEICNLTKFRLLPVDDS